MDNLLFPKVEEIEKIICQVYNNDFTILPQARAIAYYLLADYNYNCKEAIDLLLFDPSFTKRCIQQFLDTQSDFLSVEPRSLGLEIIAFKSSDKIQKSLDVKHHEIKNNRGDLNTKRKIPLIKSNLVFSDDTHVWIRWYRNDAECSRIKQEIAERKKLQKVGCRKDHTMKQYCESSIDGGRGNDDEDTENTASDEGDCSNVGDFFNGGGGGGGEEGGCCSGGDGHYDEGSCSSHIGGSLNDTSIKEPADSFASAATRHIINEPLKDYFIVEYKKYDSIVKFEPNYNVYAYKIVPISNISLYELNSQIFERMTDLRDGDRPSNDFFDKFVASASCNKKSSMCAQKQHEDTNYSTADDIRDKLFKFEKKFINKSLNFVYKYYFGTDITKDSDLFYENDDIYIFTRQFKNDDGMIIDNNSGIGSENKSNTSLRKKRKKQKIVNNKNNAYVEDNASNNVGDNCENDNKKSNDIDENDKSTDNTTNNINRDFKNIDKNVLYTNDEGDNSGDDNDNDYDDEAEYDNNYYDNDDENDDNYNDDGCDDDEGEPEEEDDVSDDDNNDYGYDDCEDDDCFERNTKSNSSRGSGGGGSSGSGNNATGDDEDNEMTFVCTKNNLAIECLQIDECENVHFIAIAYHKVTTIEISDNTYESYVHKTNTKKTIKNNDNLKTEALINLYDIPEHRNICSIIFVSELPFFYYNSLLFISNFIKFMYCYSTGQNVFDPRTLDEFRKVAYFLSESLIFLTNTNIANTSADSHGPLTAYTGERPKTLLNKIAKNGHSRDIHIVEGIRSTQSMGKSSDIGCRTTNIEIVGELKSKNVQKNYVFDNLSFIV